VDGNIGVRELQLPDAVLVHHDGAHDNVTVPAVVLSGVRRSGKTTLLYQTINMLITSGTVPAKNILFVNCDEPEIASRKGALLETVDTYRREIATTGLIWLVFDEVQPWRTGSGR